jgi:hypothetical protein
VAPRKSLQICICRRFLLPERDRRSLDRAQDWAQEEQAARQPERVSISRRTKAMRQTSIIFAYRLRSPRRLAFLSIAGFSGPAIAPMKVKT